jgi:Protein of unknown function (DUF3105)
MPTKREERERARAERLAAEQREQAAQRRRLILGYVVAGALTLAVVVGLGIVIASGGDDGGSGGDLPGDAHIEEQSGYVHDIAPDARQGTEPAAIQQGDLEVAAQEAGCELRLDLPDEGGTHVQENVDYETNPPTSGNHNPEQQADGAYAEPVRDEFAVHALEHGRIAIQYSPDLPEEDQLALKGVFDEDPFGMLMFPNPDMRYEVAATAWTQLLGCETYEGQATLDAIRDFRDTFRGRGPEAVPLQF